MMRSLLEIVLFVVPLLLTAYSLKVEPLTIKIIAWIISGLILIGAVLIQLKKAADRKNKERQDREYRRLLEGELVRQASPGGQPATYADGLPDSPLFGRFFAQGQEYEKESKFKEAIEEYKKCLLHPDGTEESRVAANILIGNCYYAQSMLREAEKHYREALDISKRVKDKSEKLQGRAAALGNIGLVLFDRGDLEGALENYGKVLKIFEKIGNLGGIAKTYGNIGPVLRQKGDLDGALKNYRKSLDITEELGLHSISANQYGNIGNVLRVKGDLEGALENHRKALEIDEKIGNQLGMAQDYGNIGNVLCQKGDLDGALENHKKALEINTKVGRPKGIAINYGNIGVVLADQGDLEGALENYDKSLEITEKIGLQSISANQYINKADIHSEKNDYKSAALFQLQALLIYSQIGMKRELGIAQHNLAISVGKLKKQGKFEEFLREAKEKFGEEVEKLLGGLFTADEAD